MKDFFEGGKLYDNQTTFCADYTSNSYTFSKLNRLISHIFTEIENNPDTYNQDPDWNKILLIPVKKSWMALTVLRLRLSEFQTTWRSTQPD